MHRETQTASHKSMKLPCCVLTLLTHAWIALPLPGQGTDALQSAFLDPAPETRPGCYWYWINDNISKEA